MKKFTRTIKKHVYRINVFDIVGNTSMIYTVDTYEDKDPEELLEDSMIFIELISEEIFIHKLEIPYNDLIDFAVKNNYIKGE